MPFQTSRATSLIRMVQSPMSKSCSSEICCFSIFDQLERGEVFFYLLCLILKTLPLHSHFPSAHLDLPSLLFLSPALHFPSPYLPSSLLLSPTLHLRSSH